MAETKIKEEFNLEQKVTVRSIAGWHTGFRRLDSIGDVSITPNGTTVLTRNEIISQINNNNVLFAGTDGKGSHATLYIEDAPTRVEVGFESEDGKEKQAILTEDTVTKIFAAKTNSSFEKAVKEAIVTRAEKYSLMQIAKKLKINDYSRIRFCENYTGFNFE